MKIFARLTATCLGLGHFPLAPGTVTSAVIVILYKFFLHKLNWPFYLLMFLLLFLLGVYVSNVYSRALKKEDPRSVVIDEAAGQLLALFLLNPQWTICLASFVLFRFFDIVKPFPIKNAEDFPKGFGIMLDDVVAALYAGILVNLYLILK
ncbi:MAG: phosphatidylglycerophosphatase A [Candidatus Aminicenantes bacterium]|nr:phosphatidylglycerophosphatase A [Candidatus Aminicenantes bacterium]MDH5384729.1 phosphatidylglycerophosphatase A [Candidatus Aminicenantes bacterium]